MRWPRSWLKFPADAARAPPADVLWRDAAAAGLASSAAARRIAVRVSPAADAGLDAELDALATAPPFAIILPRCRGGADVQKLGVKLAAREARWGLAAGSIRIVAVAGDSALGLMGLESLVGSSPRLLAIAADAPSLAAELGRKAPAAIAFARSQIALAATAAGVAALDGPFEGAFDEAAVRAQAQAAFDEGFHGKFATSPEEAAIYDEIFAQGAAAPPPP